MTIVNRHPGKCLTCRARVAPGEGVAVKVDGNWSVYCRAHAGGDAPVAAPAPSSAVEIRLAGDKARIRPMSYLGPDVWDRYQTAVGGSTFDRATRSNVAPLAIVGEIVARLGKAGFQIQADPEVTARVQAWEARAKADTTSADERAREVDAKLRERGLALFPFQAEGVRWLAPRTGALLSDDPGTGKTCQSLTALPADAPVLVVCPAVAKGVWRRECAQWRPDLTPIVLDGRGSFRWPVAREVVVINYDLLPVEPMTVEARKETEAEVKRLRAVAEPSPQQAESLARFVQAISDDDLALKIAESCPPGIVIIADEAHALKGSKTQRTRRFRALATTARKRSGRIWALTATPILNRPPELWSLLTTIGQQNVVFGNYKNFERLCGAARNRFGTEWNGAAIDSDRIAPRLREVMLRRRKEDVLDQLPEKTEEIIDVTLDTATLKRLDKIVAELAEQGIDLEKAIAGARSNQNVAFEQMARARALLATAKTAAAIDLVDDLEEAGEPVVVFSHHRSPVDLLAKRDGWASITGDTPNAERDRIAVAFQRGELKGVAGTIQAMGVSITLTRACRAIFIDHAWTPELNRQAADRIHRIGSMRPVTITHLRADHAIDQRVFELLSIKRGIIARTTDAAAVRVGELAPRVDAASVLETSRVSFDPAERARRQAAFEERVRAERAASEASRSRRKASVKAEAANRNRGWSIDPALFDTAPRAAETAAEEWAAQALAHLASMDGDHAEELNGVGFSQADTHVGHALAAAASAGLLSSGEWAVAIRLARRYPGQVGQCPSEAA